MPGRSITSDSYRYGFNGYEKDDELKGAGNSYTSRFRSYDPRLGRFTKVDPYHVAFAAVSPYNFAADNPIINIDRDGGFALTVVGGILGGAISGGYAYYQGKTGDELRYEIAKGSMAGMAAGAVLDVAYTGGASLGVTALVLSSVTASAAAELTTQVSDMVVKGEDFNTTDFLVNTAVGGALGIALHYVAKAIVPPLKTAFVNAAFVVNTEIGINRFTAVATYNQGVTSSGKQVLIQVGQFLSRTISNRLAPYKGDYVNVYRGGNSFKLKPHEIKLTDGKVRNTHGVSLDVDPNTVKSHGGAYKIDYLPEELLIKQRGQRAEHFEIVPAENAKFTPEEFQNLLDQIIVSPVETLP